VAVGSSSSEPSESEESEEVMVVVLEVLRARFLVLPALLVENNCISERGEEKGRETGAHRDTQLEGFVQ
jgi:hypothetical protein